ncbi:MAG: hypothetical protein CSA58_11275 [Micrococcales bacterium]|nr:MAG: hypothetical protein CSB46_02580 [Micrococcales bacterium]PIE26100.1 MAG: hypothetical protein CSA58_11275 [Micrococcales bacterium]
MADESPTGDLVRSIRTPSLVIHYITSVMGVGILVLPGVASSVAGPASLLAWLLLVAWSYPFALVFARLSVKVPSAGGIADFVTAAFGDRWGRRASTFLLLTLIIANPLLGLASGRYLMAVLAPEATNRTILLVGFAIILLTVLTNTLGLRLSTRVQGLLLLALIAFLVTVMLTAVPAADPSRLEPVAPHGWLAIGPALLICFFGFIGWENAAPVAEEVIDPGRTFPRAIAVAVVAVGALYFAMATTIVLVQPAGTTRTEGITAFSDLLRAGFGSSAATAGNLVAFLLMAMTANAWTLGTSRVVYSTARAGLLPARLARVDQHGTPRTAIGALALGYGASVAVLVALDLDESALITATSAAFLIVFLAAVFAATRLLDGRMRLLSWLVTAVTVALVPFFYTSLPWALLIIAAALGGELVGRRLATRTPTKATEHDRATQT